jgi:ribosomal-protein-alanine N-acetyltransferase
MVAAGEAHLLNLSIAAPRQRAGYGSLLLREAAEHARSLGARSLFLEVRPSNRGAQALYTRFGFKEDRGAPRLLSGVARGARMRWC